MQLLQLKWIYTLKKSKLMNTSLIVIVEIMIHEREFRYRFICINSTNLMYVIFLNKLKDGNLICIGILTKMPVYYVHKNSMYK